MPREATGEIRRNSSGKLSARIRFGTSRETFELPTCRTEAEAEERAKVLARLAKRFSAAGNVTQRDAIETLRMAGTATDRSLTTVLTLADELLGGELVDDSDGHGVPTFSEVVNMWADGTLAKAFPHQIKSAGKEHLDTAKARVEKDCFTPIRDVPVNLITRAMCDEVMRSLPLPRGKDEISASTRRHYAVLINRTLNLAELAGYIGRTPIPRGWLPSPGKRKRFPILYSSEDAQLLASSVPLAWRIYYGFLHREGVRREEAASLQVKDIDFTHETVSLDENKTDHPRFWKLAPGVAAALKLYVAMRDAGPDDFLFIDENGGPLRLDHMAHRVRRHLKLAELSRPDLTSTGKNKGAFGTHCFRRSMITRSMAQGKPEDWVRQRTGHTTDELLRYRQGAKALAELELADLKPLDEALSGLTPDKSREATSERLPRDCPSVRRGGVIRTRDPLSPRQVR